MKWTLAILLSVLTFVGLGLFVSRAPEPKAPAPTRIESHPDLEAQAHFGEGLALFRDSRYLEARARFGQALELSRPAAHDQARRYLEACDLELRVLDLRANAMMALRKGDLGRALARLSEVPEESLHFGEAERDRLALLPVAEGLRSLGDAEARGEVSKIVRDRAGDSAGAIDLARAVWQAVDQHLESILVTARGLVSTDPPGACRAARRGLALRPFYGERDSLAFIALDEFMIHCRSDAPAAGDPSGGGGVIGNRADALALADFNRQSFDDAESLLKDTARMSRGSPVGLAASRRLTAIRRFRQPFERGMAAHRRRDYDEGVDELTEAERRIREISLDGPLHRLIRGHLARMHVSLGQSAFNAELYPIARDHFLRAQAYDDRSKEAQLGLRQVKNTARELFLEAYTQNDDPEREKRLYQRVLTITSPDDPYHRRAKGRLDALHRRKRKAD